jgi:hypothetical protein
MCRSVAGTREDHVEPLMRAVVARDGRVLVDGQAGFSEYWFSSAIDATMPWLARFASPESM